MKTSYTNKAALGAQESSGNPVGSIFNESMNLLIKILTKLGLLTKDLDSFLDIRSGSLTKRKR
jgi:hypothetical protein